MKFAVSRKTKSGRTFSLFSSKAWFVDIIYQSFQNDVRVCNLLPLPLLLNCASLPVIK